MKCKFHCPSTNAVTSLLFRIVQSGFYTCRHGWLVAAQTASPCKAWSSSCLTLCRKRVLIPATEHPITRKAPLSLLQSASSPPSLATTDLQSNCSFAFSRMSHKWSHTICIILSVASFSQLTLLRLIHVLVCNSSFSFLLLRQHSI